MLSVNQFGKSLTWSGSQGHAPYFSRMNPHGQHVPNLSGVCYREPTPRARLASSQTFLPSPYLARNFHFSNRPLVLPYLHTGSNGVHSADIEVVYVRWLPRQTAGVSHSAEKDLNLDLKASSGILPYKHIGRKPLRDRSVHVNVCVGLIIRMHASSL